MKILHYAIENFARIPANMVSAERELGHESYLAIPAVPANHFHDEDYCLNLSFVGKKIFNRFKPFIGYKRISDSNMRKGLNGPKSYWEPGSPSVSAFFKIRDFIWEKRVRTFLKEINIDSFDIIFLDGGAGFLRNAKIIKELKSQGKKIIVTYCGSDFRSRGPIKAVEEICDYRLTFEHDHTVMDPLLDFYFAPFRMPEYKKYVFDDSDSKIRIGHAPTNRLAKGTEKILQTLNNLKKSHNIEIILIEKKSHAEALALKASCHIFIDNIGEIGYGINSLESLSMGIPTAVQIMPDLEKMIPDHPFINIDATSIKKNLIACVESEEVRKTYSEKSKNWVGKYHSALEISRQILNKIIA